MRLLFGIFLICLLPGLLCAEPEVASKDVRKMEPKEVRAYALQLQEEGKIDEAIRVYAALCAGFKSSINIPEEALNAEGWMRLLWERNNPGTEEKKGDREMALEAGRNFLKQTKRFEDRMRDNDRRLWKRLEALVLEYEMELDWEKKFSWSKRMEGE